MPTSGPKKIVDSLSGKTEIKVQHNYSHILEGNILNSSGQKAINHFTEKSVWPSYLLFICFALLVFSYLALHKRISLFFKSSFSLQAARSLQREEYKTSGRWSIVLIFLYFTSLSFFLMKIDLNFDFLSLGFSGLGSFIFFFFFLVLIYILKFIIFRVLGFILLSEKPVSEYIFNTLVTSQVAGAFLILVCIGVEFVYVLKYEFLFFGIFILALFYFFRIGKGLIIAKELRNLSVFQLFIYLCGLELLPFSATTVFLFRIGSYLSKS